VQAASSGKNEMEPPQPYFCNECGAANTFDATTCFACHQPLLPLESLPAVQSSVPLRPLLSPTTPSIPSPGPGTLLHERYQLVREIGKGGFGVVYLARDMKKRRQLVAVKQINIGKLSARESIDATDSYNREVTLLSKLRHRRLPRLYDHFTDPEHWYLVLSYIEGQTLDVYLQAQPNKALPFKKVIDIGMQLCDILLYLHTQQPPIIFRDVKPANIMQTPRGRIYLIDFGIARQFNPARIKDTGPLGSPGYAAPEQYGRTQTTVHTDIYGLGATLQTLATGKEPLELRGDEPFPGLNSRLRQKFQHLVDQMLEREGHKRPRSVLEVKARLEALKFGPFGSLRRLLFGFLLGSTPLALFLLQNILIASSDIGVCLLSALMPFLLVGLFIAAMLLLFLSRKRLVGLGIVLGLAIFLLILLTGGRFFWPLF
jgi:serine/threonine protein kinase